jgi:hypothetical protein
MFLTPEEVKELTGYQAAAWQAKWLKSNGFPFEIGGDKRLKVLRATVVSRLGGVVENTDRVREPKLHLS